MRIKELVESNSLLGDWRGPAGDNAQFSLRPPDRFRLNVRLLDSGSIGVCSYGLRWDPAETLPGPVARRLAEEIKDVCPVSLGESHGGYGDSLLFQTRTYLDNQIHWKEPRDKARQRQRRAESKAPPVRVSG